MIALLVFSVCAFIFYYFRNKNAFFLLSPFIIIIDSFSYAGAATLNFYKIFPWIYLKELIREKGVVRQLLYLLFASFLMGVVFIALNSNITNPMGANFFRSPIIKVLRNQFTLWSYVLSSYWMLKTFQVVGGKKFFKLLIYLMIVIAIGIIISGALEYDFYNILTGSFTNLQAPGYFRSKGFMFEPRGAALSLAILLPYVLFIRSNKVFTLLGLALVYALFRTLSISGIYSAIILMTCSCIFSLFLFQDRVFFIKRFFIMLSFMAITFSVFYYSPTTLGKFFRGNLGDRSFVIEGGRIGQFTPPPGRPPVRFEKFVSHFECFDAAYLNFVFQNPIYAVFGVGSGLGGVASQKYFLMKDYALFPNGSDSLPLVGAVFALAQFGLFGIGFIFYLIWINFKGSHPFVKYIMLLSLFSFSLQYLYTIFFLLFSIMLAEYIKRSDNRESIEAQFDEVLNNGLDIFS